MVHMRSSLLGPSLLLAALAAVVGCSTRSVLTTVEPVASPLAPPAAHCGYEVIAAFPHDPFAFTQGLAFHDGVLYEGTGLEGRSSLRSVDLASGAVMAGSSLPADWFGEGITVCGDRIVQLTWRNGIAREYDLHDLRVLRDVAYNAEGWGIAYDGRRLIASDGTSTLRFLDPATFAAMGEVHVHDGGMAVEGLNELEFIGGQVYANVWPTDRIAVIEPGSGRVTAWVDLSGLLASRPASGPVDVLNGIAWDEANERLFVTGKLWPWLFEIRSVPASGSAAS